MKNFTHRFFFQLLKNPHGEYTFKINWMYTVESITKFSKKHKYKLIFYELVATFFPKRLTQLK